jgi:hypothetical protein
MKREKAYVDGERWQVNDLRRPMVRWDEQHKAWEVFVHFPDDDGTIYEGGSMALRCCSSSLNGKDAWEFRTFLSTDGDTREVVSEAEIETTREYMECETVGVPAQGEEEPPARYMEEEVEADLERRFVSREAFEHFDHWVRMERQLKERWMAIQMLGHFHSTGF